MLREEEAKEEEEQEEEAQLTEKEAKHEEEAVPREEEAKHVRDHVHASTVKSREDVAAASSHWGGSGPCGTTSSACSCSRRQRFAMTATR